MKAQWKKRWLKALRSDEYEQGAGSLRKTEYYDTASSEYKTYGSPRLCCLGVLCDIAGVRWLKDDAGCKFGRVDLNEEGLKFFGLSEEHQELCVTLNDNKHRSFKQIARTIDAKF